MTENEVTLDDKINKLKVQVLVVECVMAALLITLFAFVAYLYSQVQKLNKLLKVLDPMGKYKKVGPSLYIKRPRREISSISSSFKHFDGRGNDYLKSGDQLNIVNVNEETLRRNETGTLDRNYFTRSNFNLENLSSTSKGSNKDIDTYFNEGQRKKSEAEAMDAITKLDKLLY